MIFDLSQKSSQTVLTSREEQRSMSTSCASSGASFSRLSRLLARHHTLHPSKQCRALSACTSITIRPSLPCLRVLRASKPTILPSQSRTYKTVEEAKSRYRSGVIALCFSYNFFACNSSSNTKSSTALLLESRPSLHLRWRRSRPLLQS